LPNGEESMRKSGVLRVFGILGVTLLLVVLGYGCGGGAPEVTPEQMQGLEAQRAAALSAERRVDNLEAQRAELIERRTELQADLQDAQAELAAVQERIGNLTDEEREAMGLGGGGGE
jgi:uncharacterized protein YlxW (UPF0749 family)